MLVDHAAAQRNSKIPDRVKLRPRQSEVTVYVAFATPREHAAIGRELYVPRSWTQDAARCQAAGIPSTVDFDTKLVHLLRRNTLPSLRNQVTSGETNRITRHCLLAHVGPLHEGRPRRGLAHWKQPQPTACHHRDSSPT
ncbi:transposase [Streptomyces atratus]